MGSALFCDWSKAPSSAANRAGISPAFWAKVKRPSRAPKISTQSSAIRTKLPSAMRRPIRAEPTRTRASRYQMLDIA